MEYLRSRLNSTAKEKNTASPANMARLGRESLRSISGRTEPSTPASVTATTFSGATMSAATVTVARAPLTTVPTAIWVGKLAMRALACGQHGPTRTGTGRVLGPLHLIRVATGRPSGQKAVIFRGPAQWGQSGGVRPSCQHRRLRKVQRVGSDPIAPQ